MPVQKIHKSTVRSRKGATGGKIRHTKEWQDAMEIITSASLKPFEAVSITFSNGSVKLKNPCTAMVIQLRKEIRKIGLPYDVERRAEEEVYIISR